MKFYVKRLSLLERICFESSSVASDSGPFRQNIVQAHTFGGDSTMKEEVEL